MIDAHNHTGYAQVLKEIGDSNTVYVLGRDVLAQAVGSADPEYLLYDAHGSVRALADTGGSITEKYGFDAYGSLLDFAGTPSTSLLYSGEMRDPYTLDYFLRSRWYKPSSGRFNRLDEFAGNNFDPQSLHKYLYAHANPVGRADPSGQFSFVNVLVGLGIALGLLRILIGVADIYRSAVGRRGKCGENITAPFAEVIERINDNWDYWLEYESQEARNRRCSFRKHPWVGWDIDDLNNKRIKGWTGSCRHTATLQGRCYHQGAINYYLWGRTGRFCGDTLGETLKDVRTWKMLIGADVDVYEQAMSFTKAGYFGQTTFSGIRACFKNCTANNTATSEDLWEVDWGRLPFWPWEWWQAGWRPWQRD
ncbi:MAG: RHS repeat-associated core domain-containing protein [Planctomycetota bacterium]